MARDLSVPRLDVFGRGSSPQGRLALATQGNPDMANPFEFIQAVRSEAAKITWPSRRETLVTTGFVFFMVFVATVFFFVVDYVLQLVVRLVLGLAH